jgi:hypothetical protein
LSDEPLRANEILLEMGDNPKGFKKEIDGDLNNKFKTDFAGDTFSQISSTFEP